MAQILKNVKTPIIDLTPMVDLGFLLITFFMFTTTMSKPKALQLQMPYRGPEIREPNVIPEDAALTIVIGADHSFYTYRGTPNSINESSNIDAMKVVGADALRDKILEAKKEVDQFINNGTLDVDEHLTVVIKPSSSSNTEQLITVLDEMTISQIQIFAVDELTPYEHSLFKLL